MAPSLALLERRGFTREQAKNIRAEIVRYEQKYRFSRPIPWNTLERIGKHMGGEEVQEIPPGTGARSPRILYVNKGDPYETTVLWIGGNFRIGCWGDIVERGNYR